MIADTGRSSGKVMRQNRCQPLAPSSAGGLVEVGRDVLQPGVEDHQVERDADPDVGDDDRPAATSPGEVSQLTGPIPNACRAALTMPESLLSIHDQVEAETISGSSHGTRNNARSVGRQAEVAVEEHRQRQADGVLEGERDQREQRGVATARGRKVGVGERRPGSCPAR